MNIKCILFDRDGTLGYLDDERFPQTFHAFAPIATVFAQIKAKGYTVGIITNQSSIARGTGNQYDFNKEFASYGADIWKICPHDNHHNCDCRKPKSGLLLAATKDLGIAPEHCLVIGDRISDVICAKNVGAQAALVLTGKGIEEQEQVKRTYSNVKILKRFDEILSFL